MSYTESLKKELIDFIHKEMEDHRCIKEIYECCNVNSYEEYFKCMNSKTVDEIDSVVCIKFYYHLNGIFTNVDMFFSFLTNKIRDKKTDFKFNNLEKDIAAIKEQLQNTADIVNLFTDIDKNRANIEDKINKLDQKMNKLETNMDQILNLLQKS